MLFRVLYIDARGARSTQVRDAPDEETLRAALKAEGSLAISVTRESTAASAQGLKHQSSRLDISSLLHPRAFDIEMGFRQLSSMLRSGIPLLSAIETVANESPRAARKAWARVSAKVMGGHPFSLALKEQVKIFGETAVRLAEVGERSGELEHTLSRAADEMEARRSLKSTVVNALAYPLVAVAMAIGVSAYLVVAVIPKIAAFLRAGGTELPAITQMLMDFSDWTLANGFYVLGAVVAAAVCWWVVRLSEGGRELEDAFLMRIPITGRILRLSGTALFSRSMQIMIESGVTLIDSLSAAALLLQNRRLRRRVADAREAVLKGGTLADSLKSAREFMPMLARMAAVGELAGSLQETFSETARFHDMLLAVAVKRFGMMIEPVMIAITGAIVGFVYVAFFIALFSVAGAA